MAFLATLCSPAHEDYEGGATSRSSLTGRCKEMSKKLRPNNEDLVLFMRYELILEGSERDTVRLSLGRWRDKDWEGTGTLS